jgi:hypothetical protein
LKRVFWSLTILIASIGAPLAHADMFTYNVAITYTGVGPKSLYSFNGVVSFITDPISVVTTETVVPAADLSAQGDTLDALNGCPLTSGILDVSGGGGVGYGLGGACGGTGRAVPTFSLSDYANGGTYTVTATNTNGLGETESVTMIVTDIPSAVPEPSYVILLLTMLLAVAFVARKRVAQGL